MTKAVCHEPLACLSAKGQSGDKTSNVCCNRAGLRWQPLPLSRPGLAGSLIALAGRLFEHGSIEDTDVAAAVLDRASLTCIMETMASVGK